MSTVLHFRTIRLQSIRVRDELTPPFRHTRPNPTNTVVARTEGYTYVWALRIVQASFSVAPCQTLIVRNTSTQIAERHSSTHAEGTGGAVGSGAAATPCGCSSIPRTLTLTYSGHHIRRGGGGRCAGGGAGSGGAAAGGGGGLRGDGAFSMRLCRFSMRLCRFSMRLCRFSMRLCRFRKAAERRFGTHTTSSLPHATLSLSFTHTPQPAPSFPLSHSLTTFPLSGAGGAGGGGGEAQGSHGQSGGAGERAGETSAQGAPRSL
jgi:hypothetical protein